MTDLNISGTNPSVSNSTAGELMSADVRLDLRGTPCPINFVRTKLQLAKMASGALLEVWLDPGEPVEQVPDSLVMEGFSIETMQFHADYCILQIRKPA